MQYILGMGTSRRALADAYMVGGIVMLVVWAVLTIATEAPGAVHLLLTAGVFVIIWRMVVRSTPSGPAASASSATTSGSNSVSRQRHKR